MSVELSHCAINAGAAFWLFIGLSLHLHVIVWVWKNHKFLDIILTLIFPIPGTDTFSVVLGPWLLYGIAFFTWRGGSL